MHIVTFAPTARAREDDNGGLRAEGFPLTSFQVKSFPQRITIPLILAAYTESGTDYDPRVYIGVQSPAGERLSVSECTWHWPDARGVPVKHWVLAWNLVVPLQSPGTHRIGLFDSEHASVAMQYFPLPVAQSTT